MAGHAWHGGCPVSASAAVILHSLTVTCRQYELFAALRLLDRASPGLPRLGRSARPVDDPVRLRHVPTLSFATSDIVRVDVDSAQGVPAIHGQVLGLFGPNAPLPLHLTEYAMQRQLNHRDPSLVAFADIFHHRILGLFFRAWADALPTVQADRPDDDRFQLYLGALTGLATPGLQARDSFPDRSKRHFIGRLAALARNSEGLQAVLQKLFNVPVRIREFVPEWMPLPMAARLQLGVRPTNQLGREAVLGATVRGCQHRFRVHIGPLGLDAFRAWLPGGEQLEQLTAVIRGYAGDSQAWDVQLRLKADHVPRMQLGRNGRIGLDSWLGQRAWSVNDADDVVVRPRLDSALTPQQGIR